MATSAVQTAPEKPVQGVSYTIGDLAREFDLTTRAIRFYEDCGLITPQRSGRNRVYSARDRTRLKLTLRGKRLGREVTRALLAEARDNGARQAVLFANNDAAARAYQAIGFRQVGWYRIAFLKAAR